VIAGTCKEFEVGIDARGRRVKGRSPPSQVKVLLRFLCSPFCVCEKKMISSEEKGFISLKIAVLFSEQYLYFPKEIVGFRARKHVISRGSI